MTHPKSFNSLTMSRITNLILIIFSSLHQYEAAKILAIVPTPSISHQVVFRPLTRELVNRGHEVVIITTDPVFPKGQAPKNLTEIDIHDMSYAAWKTLMTAVTSETLQVGSAQDELAAFFKKQMDLFEQQTQLPEVQDIIKNQNGTFDLILTEAWVRHVLGFSHVIKAPVIQISSFSGMFDNFNAIGAPTHPLLYPSALNVRIYNLTFWEKISEVYNYYSTLKVYYKDEEFENSVCRKIFGEDMPPLSELQNNVDMLFLNIHPIWEGNRPVPPGVVFLGGLHQNPEKELPAELKDYLDASTNGVIYISFGSNVDLALFPPAIVQAIIDAVSELPYNVLWKWNHNELPGKTDNIKISKWLPQSDLLRHTNIKLFITQGGLQSTDEAITAGVPLLCIPVMGDQYFNAEKYVHHKIGLMIRILELNADDLREAITKIIGDESYRNNIVRLRNLMRDEPMTPLERAVWWTEHVLRHGGARHLRAPAANMSWTQYYEIELVLTVLAVSISVIVLSLFALYYVIKIVKRLLGINIKVKKS